MPTNENACYLILDDGGHPLTVRLDDNESAAALKALLANGPVTLPASNYPYEEARQNDNGLAFPGRKSGITYEICEKRQFLIALHNAA